MDAWQILKKKKNFSKVITYFLVFAFILSCLNLSYPETSQNKFTYQNLATPSELQPLVKIKQVNGKTKIKPLTKNEADILRKRFGDDFEFMYVSFLIGNALLRIKQYDNTTKIRSLIKDVEFLNFDFSRLQVRDTHILIPYKTGDGRTLILDYFLVTGDKIPPEAILIPINGEKKVYLKVVPIEIPEALRVVGVPKEIKHGENRVGLTPQGVKFLVGNAVTVIVEKGAGLASGFSDEEYVASGANIAETAKEVWKQATIIKKVKEPLPTEYQLIRPQHIIFTYLHLASDRELTETLCWSGCTAIGYETVVLDGRTPLLEPMSEVAGILSAYQAGVYLNYSDNSGRLTESGQRILQQAYQNYPDIPKEINLDGKNAIVLGGGVVGLNSALILAKIGAKVAITEPNTNRQKALRNYFKEQGLNIEVLDPGSNLQEVPKLITDALENADVIIGAVYIHGARAPTIINEDLLRQISSTIKKVIVDVAIDQGGSIYGSHPTTHQDPAYLDEFGNIRYAVSNMPSALPSVASKALEKASIKYTLALTGGVESATSEFPELKSGINVYKGHLLNEEVARGHGFGFINIEGIDIKYETILRRLHLGECGLSDIEILLDALDVSNLPEEEQGWITRAVPNFLIRIKDKLVKLRKIVVDASSRKGKVTLVQRDIDIIDVIKDVLKRKKIEADRKHLVLKISGHGTIKGFYELVRDIIENLIDNAIKYSNEGGTIEITVVEKEGGITIEVKDEGAGIKKEDLERIFEGYVAPIEGVAGKIYRTGVGLSLTKDAVRFLDGDIRADSKGLGEGSVFTVELPKESELSKEVDSVHLISTFSHDINNKIMGILWDIETILNNPELNLSNEQQELLVNIQRKVEVVQKELEGITLEDITEKTIAINKRYLEAKNQGGTQPGNKDAELGEETEPPTALASEPVEQSSKDSPTPDYWGDIPDGVISLVQQCESLDDLERLLDRAILEMRSGGKFTKEALSYLEMLTLIFGFEHKPHKGLVDSSGTIFKNAQVDDKDKEIIHQAFYSSERYEHNEEIRWESDSMWETIEAQAYRALGTILKSDSRVKIFPRIKQYKSLILKLERLLAKLESVGIESGSLSVAELVVKIMKHRFTIASDPLKHFDDMFGIHFIIDESGMTKDKRAEALDRYSEQVRKALLDACPSLRITRKSRAASDTLEGTNLLVQGWLKHKELGNLPIRIQFRFKKLFCVEAAMYYVYKINGRWELPPWAEGIDFGSLTSFRQLQEALFANFRRYFASYKPTATFLLKDAISMPEGMPSLFDLSETTTVENKGDLSRIETPSKILQLDAGYENFFTGQLEKMLGELTDIAQLRPVYRIFDASLFVDTNGNLRGLGFKEAIERFKQVLMSSFPTSGVGRIKIIITSMNHISAQTIREVLGINDKDWLIEIRENPSFGTDLSLFYKNEFPDSDIAITYDIENKDKVTYQEDIKRICVDTRGLVVIPALQVLDAGLNPDKYLEGKEFIILKPTKIEAEEYLKMLEEINRTPQPVEQAA